jgi:hypothetical protein
MIALHRERILAGWLIGLIRAAVSLTMCPADPRWGSTFDPD